MYDVPHDLGAVEFDGNQLCDTTYPFEVTILDTDTGDPTTDDTGDSGGTEDTGDSGEPSTVDTGDDDEEPEGCGGEGCGVVES